MLVSLNSLNLDIFHTDLLCRISANPDILTASLPRQKQLKISLKLKLFKFICSFFVLKIIV